MTTLQMNLYFWHQIKYLKFIFNIYIVQWCVQILATFEENAQIDAFHHLYFFNLIYSFLILGESQKITI